MFERISRLVIICAAVLIGVAGPGFALQAASPGQLADSILERVPREDRAADALPSIEAFRDLATSGAWTEYFPDAEGKDVARQVEGVVWSAAIEASLRLFQAVYLPDHVAPYYLDRPIVLMSGQRLLAGRDAELRLKPGTNTCMVRNEHIVSGAQGPVSTDGPTDSDIVIDGGIWTTLHTSPSQNNGNDGARSAKQDGVPGCHGLMLLSNVRRFQVRNVTIRQTKAFGLHLSNCSEFVVDNITFQEHGRDGVHVNGPASFGVIRNVHGTTADDLVALNAWDWRGSAPAFGPIHHIIVERIRGSEPGLKATDEIRLLPGMKRFEDGSVMECPIHDVVLRDLTDLKGFKLYDQPNLEAGRENDYSISPGKLSNIQFQRLAFSRPSRMEIADDVDGLSIDDLKLDFAGADSRPFVEIGPMSVTYKHGVDDPAKWVELFSPDRDVTVRRFSLTNVQVQRHGAIAPLKDPVAHLVRLASQTLNPDYPHTTPRGGTGKVIFLP